MALVTSPGPQFLDTKTYAAQRVRYLNQHAVPQEGVVGELAGLDYKVTQRGAGANMSVDVAAGGAWIKGDTGTRQGFYHLINDATVNLVVGAAHGTLPRIDQVIATIFDSTVAGGSDLPVLSVLPGTATSGATLDNRTGAAALPNDAIRLSDFIVPAASASVVNANIRDRRTWCRGFSYGADSPGTGNFTTASGTFVDTGKFGVRLECSGAPVEAIFNGELSIGTAGQAAIAGIYMDGATEIARAVSRDTNSGQRHLHRLFTPSAGSHAFAVVLAATGGATATLLDNGADLGHLILREMAGRPNASN